MSGNTGLILWILILIMGAVPQALLAQTSDNQTFLVEASADSVVSVLLASDGRSSNVGSGLVVRSDGYILTAYHLVKGARDIQVRLRNGETYDKAEIVSVDERRNVVLLHINAEGLRVIPGGTIEEAQVGTRIFVIANPSGESLINKDGLLNSVQLADNIQGAGNGYRVLQFNSAINENAAGGLVLDERGRSLGIITTNPAIKNQNIAVPLSSVLGLIRSAAPNSSNIASSIYPPQILLNKPYPIPQSSVQVPQRGVLPLTPKGPGSVVVKPQTPQEILAASKTIYVQSGTVFFKPEQLVNELLKRKEINEWGLSFVDERETADLILEIDHLLFTYKFSFKIYSQRLGVVIATGDAIIWDGNLGAPKMADRVIEKLSAIRERKPNVSKDKAKDTN
jgi:S1-C subfamily serine protease